MRQTGQDLSAPQQDLIQDYGLLPGGCFSPCPAPRDPNNSGRQTRCLWFVDLSPRRPSEAWESSRTTRPRGCTCRARSTTLPGIVPVETRWMLFERPLVEHPSLSRPGCRL